MLPYEFYLGLLYRLIRVRKEVHFSTGSASLERRKPCHVNNRNR
jgi:hypothetical protein